MSILRLADGKFRAIASTSFGRSLLNLANQTELQALVGTGGSSSGGLQRVIVEASKGLSLSDSSTYQDCRGTQSTLITIPPQSSVSWAANTQIFIARTSVASLTLSAGLNVALNGIREGSVDIARHSAIMLYRLATDTWAAHILSAPAQVSDPNAALPSGWVRRWKSSQGITLSNGTIETWADVNGHLARQSSEARRPIIANGGGLEFDGSNDFLVTDSANFSVGGVFVVYRQLSTGVSNWNGLLTARSASSSKSQNSDETILLTTVGSGGRNRFLTGHSNTSSIFINGVQVSTTDFINFSVGVDPGMINTRHLVYFSKPSTAGGSKTFTIGADTFESIGNRHFHGVIEEIILYPQELSTSDRVAATNALKSFYAIP